MKFIYLITGGAIGTTARYALSGLVYRFLGAGFPYGTFCVNLLGCFILGFFVTFFERKFTFNANISLLVITGFCGAFTTFSTFIFETGHLLKDGQLLQAFSNVLLSVLIGLVVFRLGIFLGEIL